MRWLQRIRERNARWPIDDPYTLTYTIGELPLPQPWRTTHPDAFYVPTEFVLKFTDRDRISLLRSCEPDYLHRLADTLLTDGLQTPLELWMDSQGKVRLQEGYHRMCVISSHLEEFPRIPVLFKESSGKIKSYGRPIMSEFEFLLKVLGTRYDF